MGCSAALAGKDLIRRWKAQDLSKGKIEERNVGVGAWFLIPSDVRPVLASKGMSDDQAIYFKDRALIAGSSYSVSDTESSFSAFRTFESSAAPSPQF